MKKKNFSLKTAADLIAAAHKNKNSGKESLQVVRINKKDGTLDLFQTNDEELNEKFDGFTSSDDYCGYDFDDKHLVFAAISYEFVLTENEIEDSALRKYKSILDCLSCELVLIDEAPKQKVIPIRDVFVAVKTLMEYQMIADHTDPIDCIFDCDLFIINKMNLSISSEQFADTDAERIYVHCDGKKYPLMIAKRLDSVHNFLFQPLYEDSIILHPKSTPKSESQKQGFYKDVKIEHTDGTTEVFSNGKKIK